MVGRYCHGKPEGHSSIEGSRYNKREVLSGAYPMPDLMLRRRAPTNTLMRLSCLFLKEAMKLERERDRSLASWFPNLYDGRSCKRIASLILRRAQPIVGKTVG